MNSSSIGSILDVVSGLQKQTSSSARESSKGVQDIEQQLYDISERIKSAEACAKNSRVWKAHHRLERVRALVPAAPRDGDDRRNGAKKGGELKWTTHQDFPRTVAGFKELRHNAKKVRSLLEFYNVIVYHDDDDDDKDDPVRVDLHPSDKCRDVEEYMDSCMEALAITWGLDFQKIGGLDTLRHRSAPRRPGSPLSRSEPGYDR